MREGIRVYDYDEKIELTFYKDAFPLLEDFSGVLKEVAGTRLENEQYDKAFQALKTFLEIHEAIEKVTAEIAAKEAEEAEKEDELLNMPFVDDPQEDDRK